MKEEIKPENRVMNRSQELGGLISGPGLFLWFSSAFRSSSLAETMPSPRSYCSPWPPGKEHKRKENLSHPSAEQSIPNVDHTEVASLAPRDHTSHHPLPWVSPPTLNLAWHMAHLRKWFTCSRSMPLEGPDSLLWGALSHGK